MRELYDGATLCGKILIILGIIGIGIAILCPMSRIVFG